MSWTQHILLSHLYPLGGFLPHLENFTPNLQNVRNTIIVANTNIVVGKKILTPEFVPPKKNYPLLKFLNSCNSCEFSLFGKPSFLLLDLNSKIFTPGVKFLNLTINIIRCLLLKYWLIFLLYLFISDSPKGSSNTSKTRKNISLYFKKRHLIIYKYFSLLGDIFTVLVET